MGGSGNPQVRKKPVLNGHVSIWNEKEEMLYYKLELQFTITITNGEIGRGGVLQDVQSWVNNCMIALSRAVR